MKYIVFENTGPGGQVIMMTYADVKEGILVSYFSAKTRGDWTTHIDLEKALLYRDFFNTFIEECHAKNFAMKTSLPSATRANKGP